MLATGSNDSLIFPRVLFAIPPTGAYCREDRCQSYFQPELIPSMRPPLEECEGAGGVLRAGGVAAVIDASGERLSSTDFLTRVGNFSPSLVVLGVTFGSLDDDLQWAARIHAELPGVTIAVRGAPCYVWGAEILARAPEVEFCVRGDYELVFEQLCRHGHKGAGLTFRSPNGKILESPAPFATHLDELPFQDRSSIDSSRYTVRGSSHPQATIHVQRGCPFPCTFCLVHTVSGNKARHRSPESIVAEVQGLLREGITHFYLRAETFSLDKRWAIEVGRALASACPQARWVTATRVECVDDEVIEAMRAGGCYGISFGVDVASAEIGRRVKKPPNLAKAKEAMRLCDRHGVISLAYIMIGFVWDTEETVAEAARFVKAIRPDLLTIHFAHPYPGTPYFSAMREAGMEVVSLRAQATPALEGAALSPTALNRYARRMLLSHYSSPAVLLSIAKKGLRNRFHNLLSPRLSPRLPTVPAPTVSGPAVSGPAIPDPAKEAA